MTWMMIFLCDLNFGSLFVKLKMVNIIVGIYNKYTTHVHAYTCHSEFHNSFLWSFNDMHIFISKIGTMSHISISGLEVR